MFSPAITIAALITLIPYLAVAFFAENLAGATRKLPVRLRLIGSAVLCVPYVLVAYSSGIFHWGWLALYALLPVAVSVLMDQARRVDPEQHGNWRDFLVLAVLGLAIDLRWFEHAWPAHLAVFNKILLLDAGIYGLLLLRRLDGVGFDLRLRLRDAGVGLRELVFYAPIALALGLSLGFLHLHATWPWLPTLAGAFLFTFFFIAVPEELFFRGWLQNLLERRIGRVPALLLTAALFGLSHFNKRAVYFNWRYVLLAALAGVFYGRAWRQQRRVGASAITHACVDTIWSFWLR
jgi:membrane protease YdiL (CAAX protease family)